MFVGVGKARACQNSRTTQPTSNYNSGCVDPARQLSCWAQCLRALLVRQLFALLHFLRSCALWPSSPDVTRASGLSGLFGVWLALPECDVVSLAGRVSLPFGFAAVLPPATFTCVYCRAYSFSLLRSFCLSCRSSPIPWFFPLFALRVGSIWLLSSASLALSSLLSAVFCRYCALAALTRAST